jgi:predicted membrane GTPase involved in stress response
MDIPSENIEQNIVVYVVKEALNVNLDCPVVTMIANEKTNSFSGMMGTAIRSKTITMRVLFTFVDRLRMPRTAS